MRNRTVRDAAESLKPYLDKDQINLLLVRHGQPGPGREVRGLHGRPLTPLGRRQARLVAQRLAPLPLDHIYASDMARAYQTAEPLRALCPAVPYTTMPELREVSAFHHPGTLPARTLEQRRVRREQREAAQRFIEQIRQQHPPGDLLAVVAHGNLHRLLCALLADIESRKSFMMTMFHTAVTILALFPDGRTQIKLLNCTRHLSADLIGSNNL